MELSKALAFADGSSDGYDDGEAGDCTCGGGLAILENKDIGTLSLPTEENTHSRIIRL